MSREHPAELIAPVPPPTGFGRPKRGAGLRRMLRRRWPLMASAFVVLAAAVALAAWLFVPLEYTAAAILQFTSSEPPAGSGAAPSQSASSYERQVNSYVALVTDPSVLAPVANDEAVGKLPEVSAQADRLRFLQDHLTAQVLPHTELVEVRGAFARPETARTVVAAVVRQLEMRATVTETKHVEKVRTMLDAELRKWSAAVETYQGAIRQVQGRVQAPYMKLDGMGGAGNALQALVGGAERDQAVNETALQNAQAAVAEIEALEAARKENPAKEIYLYDIETAARREPTAESYRNEVVRLEAEIDGSNMLPEHPQMRQKVAQLDKARENQSRALANARRTALNAQLEMARQREREAQALADRGRQMLEDYRRRLAEERKNATDLVGDMQLIEDLKGKLETARERQRDLENELNRARLKGDAPPRVYRPAPMASGGAESALMPVRVSHERRLTFVLAGLLGAAGIALALGLVRELTDHRLRSSEDVTRITPLPVLASIPHLSEDRLPPDAQTAMLSRDFPESVSAEEFRRILTRIIYPPDGAIEIKTMLVTSPARGDGKTSLACNLALSLAQANRRVLVVDISARRPGVEKSFGLEPDHGLGEILSGEHSPEDVLRPTDYPNVFVLGPGFLEREASGRLGSREALEFFEGAEHAFDHVIIDTPPCLLLSDARLLAPVVDGVILVAGVGVSTSGMMRRCLHDLQQGGAHVIGVVLNGVRTERGGRLRRNRDAYYAYGEPGNGHGASRNGAMEALPEPKALPAAVLLDDAPPSPDRDA